MKNLTICLVFLALFQVTAISQSCLPDGIIFTSQSQIDSFPINYPNCTEIEGDVGIEGSINNLSGLNVLTSIGGNFVITNSLLQNLSGLENLTSVGGHLIIGGWGMNAMPFQPIECSGNSTLSNLSALSNLTSVGGSLVIYCNNSLSSLSGLENLTTIAGSLHIGYAVDSEFEYGTAGNSALTSLTGLEGLTYVGGEISIQGNLSLESLTGLNNGILIDGDLIIRYNSSLSTCEAQSICEYLDNPNGTVEIHSNAMGCNSPADVSNGCSITISCLPHGNYYFLSQSDIDNFQTNYPTCTELEGDVIISGNNDITNLMGLSVLSSIGGYLHVGGWELVCNPLLTSLTGLEGLTSVGGLSIILNDTLSSLTGLDNIEAASITDLTIWANHNLSFCEVKSICDYLAAPNGEINLWSNAPGCNSPEEVEEACDDASVYEVPVLNWISIFPNPFLHFTTIAYELKKPAMVEMIIYNHLGVEVDNIKQQQLAKLQEFNWTPENLPSGIYFCVLKTNKGIQTTKIIKL